MWMFLFKMLYSHVRTLRVLVSLVYLFYLLLLIYIHHHNALTSMLAKRKKYLFNR